MNSPAVQQTLPRTRSTTGSGRSTAAQTVDLPCTDRLIALYRAVRAAVLNSGRESTGVTNAKGDEVKQFDLVANDAAVTFLSNLSVPLIIESEEAERHQIGSGTPCYRLVLDPVDGSDNWARGLPLSALSCAVMPIDAPLHPDGVESAMVGPLDQETPLIARKGSGAWRGAARLETSGVRHIADAVISIELNHFAPPGGVARLMADARGVRCYGCASRALAFVASGATDAHVDVRGRLTPESYLAAARLVIEAGGCVTGCDGAPLPAARSLSDRTGLIAAASRALCDEIVERLSDGGL